MPSLVTLKNEFDKRIITFIYFTLIESNRAVASHSFHYIPGLHLKSVIVFSSLMET